MKSFRLLWGSILTMLLGYEVMGDPFHRRSVEKSLEFLVKVRSGAGLPVGAAVSVFSGQCRPTKIIPLVSAGLNLGRALSQITSTCSICRRISPAGTCPMSLSTPIRRPDT